MSWRTEILIKGTSGPSQGVTNGQILAFLDEWAARAEFSVDDVAGDRLTLTFSRLPDDLDALASAIYRVCPDSVDRHFGCLDETLEACEEAGRQPPAELLELVEGLDFGDRHHGLVAMARSLRRDRAIRLSWD